jgi:hypothetical protein
MDTTPTSWEGYALMYGTFENRFLEWRATVTVCQNSKKKWLFDVFARLRLSSLRENPLILPEYF